MDRRVPFLAHKLPGTQGCLPGFDVFSPRSRGASYHSQNGQYGSCVPHKPSKRFTVAHPGQACAPSSPLVPGQVPFFEGGSRSGNTEPCRRFSVETETQAGRMDVEPSDGIPDLGSVWQSGGGPLCFSTTTLRVYVAAIAARRELDEIPLGRHRMVSAFMRGVRRLRPVRPTAVLSWDLLVVLEGQVTAPFEPLESALERILTLKVALLLALTSLKRVGDLQALSVSEMCMDFAPDLVKVTLRPRPGYIPKVLSTSFRSQVVTLHSFHPPPFASSKDERLHMLWPVRALKLYVDRSKVWRKSSQLLVCFGAGRCGLATSKQRISHWVRDAISLAYEARNLPSPLSLRAHSTRGVATSQALFRGVPQEDICVVAGWSSPHTFVRFYNLDIDTAPGSQILSV